MLYGIYSYEDAYMLWMEELTSVWKSLAICRITIIMIK